MEIITTQKGMEQAAKNFVLGKKYFYEEGLDDKPFMDIMFKGKRGGAICTGTPSYGSRWIQDTKSDPKDPTMVRTRTFKIEKPTKRELQECAEYKSPRERLREEFEPRWEPDLPVRDYADLPVKKSQLAASNEDKGGIPMWVWYSIGGIAAFYAYRHFSK